MKQNFYYISTAPNPIELAELNVPFYKAFIEDMGCSSLYRDLWPGEDLAAFIQTVCQYHPEGDVMKAKKSMVIVQYEKFYKQLTGYPLK